MLLYMPMFFRSVDYRWVRTQLYGYRLFTDVLVGAFAHGFYLMMDQFGAGVTTYKIFWCPACWNGSLRCDL
ncbi:hypothetical protein ACE6H2_019896 [Prunus campanulata]